MTSECRRCGAETARPYAVVSGNRDLLAEGYYCDACTVAIREFANGDDDDD